MLPLSANQIEGAALTGWPALKEAYDGLWLWRYANGFTRRANSSSIWLHSSPFSASRTRL